MEIKLTDKEKTQKILSPHAVYGIMQRILLRENEIDQEKEHFWMVGMNAAGYILYIELVSLGNMRSTIVEPMNVYRFAVMKNADRVIAVHNHPGGNLTPSETDKDLTDLLIAVGRILRITLEDHLIISTKAYLSFGVTGLMAQLRTSLRYVPSCNAVEKIRMEQKAIAKLAVKEEIKTAKQKTKAAEEKAKEAKLALKAERDQRAKDRQIFINVLLKKNMTTEEIAKILKVTPKEVEAIIKKKK